MTDTKPQCRPPPITLLRLIFDHQRWLSSNGRFGKRLDRDELQFENCDLDGVDLSGASLAFAYFAGGTIRGGRFLGANLARAQFISCDVEGANFSRANLTEATFATNHKQACFDEANLENVAWSEEEGVKLRKAAIRRILRQPPPAQPR